MSLLLLALAATPAAAAAESTGSVEPTPTVPPVVTIPLPSAAPAEDEPVGIWPALSHGRGTDSRDAGDAEASEVRWRFALKGAPKGTEFTVFAEFASAGELRASGTLEAVLVTRGHDTLLDASAQCIVPASAMEGVRLELVGVEVVPGTREASASSSASGERYLPYTGPSDGLPVLAALAAALGLCLRRLSSAEG